MRAVSIPPETVSDRSRGRRRAVARTRRRLRARGRNDVAHLSDDSVSVPAAEWQAMKSRLADLEARLDAATPQRVAGPVQAPELAPKASLPNSEPVASADGRIDRRHLLGRAGTAAVGAVLGGAAATIATATPAAAATGTFDSTDGTTALTASNTGGGRALALSANGPAPALDIVTTTS